MLVLIVESDPIAVWGLIVAVVAVVVGVVAAIAAIYAAVYAKAAPTKEDLGRVEQNTASTTQHLQRQSDKNALFARVERVSITVWGQDPLNENLHLQVKCDDPEVLVTGIALFNEQGVQFGGGSCIRDPEGDHYWTEIEPDTLIRWIQGGTRFYGWDGPGPGRNASQPRHRGPRDTPEAIRQYFSDNARTKRTETNVLPT